MKSSSILSLCIMLVVNVARGNGNVCPAGEYQIPKAATDKVEDKINDGIKKKDFGPDIAVKKIGVANLKLREVKMMDKEICLSLNFIADVEYTKLVIWFLRIQADMDFDLRIQFTNGDNAVSLKGCDYARSNVQLPFLLNCGCVQKMIADKLKSLLCEGVKEKLDIKFTDFISTSAIANSASSAIGNLLGKKS